MLGRSKEISVFTDEFHYATNFLPGDEVIGDSFLPFLFKVWRWSPHMPRHCEGTFRGIVKGRAISTTTALIAVREVKPFEVGTEKSISSNSRIISFNPLYNVLRVGGRLGNANIPENQKHQVILPQNTHVIELIVKHFHKTHLHGGTSLTISAIWQKYWIINCRDAVCKVIRNCIKCFKNRTNTASQIMADLPAARVVPNKVFFKVDIDYAGTFLVKPEKGGV
ncbi:hypothetical protein AVEN_156604-1 [Araneus ventricosus]|uniref:Integrase zinc-binding domain-containing protein n=1 Tax=Araneus ventricosus TaxID=182803 RepID=A0A4Y2EX83_ARAVE|nr:hypothetical protein AVEN_156604-1 [Araneus ventricosus]